MRFLFVGRFTDVGGSALATIPLIRALQADGHHITLVHWVMPNQTDWFADSSLLNLELTHQKGLFSKIRRLTQLADEYDTIVAISEMTPTYACHIAGWLARRPVYGELHVHLDHWIQGNSARVHHWLIRQFYPRLSGLRCVSAALQDYATQTLGVPLDKTFVVHNGFDLAHIQTQSTQPLPPPAQRWFRDPVILGVGRLYPQKRFDLAIQAFEIARPHLPANTRFLILGDGPLEQDLAKLIHALNLHEWVHLTGRQPNPFVFFAHATAFLLSSDYEGFGRVLVEAMICGCPIIAADCPVGPREVLENGRSGYLVNDNQPQTLAKAMVYLLSRPNLQQQLIQAGRTRSQNFEQTRVSKRYAAILQERLPQLTQASSNPQSRNQHP